MMSMTSSSVTEYPNNETMFGCSSCLQFCFKCVMYQLCTNNYTKLTREAEKVQNQAYRYFLGVSSKHPLAAASGDMCWMPTSCRHKLAIVAFWRHLVQSDNNKICKKVYIECKRLADEHNQDNWASQVKEILAECALQSWWHQSSLMGSHLVNSSM